MSDPESKYYSWTGIIRAGVVADVAMKAYQMTLIELGADDEESNSEATVMLNTKHPTNDDARIKFTDEMVAAFFNVRDHEIIAAIITAGMLPTLPVPKLRKIADGWRESDLLPMVDLVSSAVTLYLAMRSLVQKSEERGGGLTHT